MEKISVLIPTRNRDDFLKEALDSLQGQTYPDWEAIVVDNGDGACTRVVAQQYNDSRIIYVKAPRNLGECGGRNLAVAHASGDFFCYLDDDDVLPPDSLSARLAFYRQHPGCGMIYGAYRRFSSDQGVWNDVPENVETPLYCKKQYYDGVLKRLRYNQQDTFHLLKLFNFVRGGTPLIRRRTLEAVGLFDERFLYYGDYEMWLRVASRYPIRFLNKVVYLYRIHAGSISFHMTENSRSKECALLLCRKYNIRRSVQFAQYQSEIDRLYV